MAQAQLKVRMPEPLRAALEDAARRRGVSMNAETVRRLQWSFDVNERIESEFAGDQLFGLMRSLAMIMQTAGVRANRLAGHDYRDGWLNSPYAYEQAMQAAVRVLDALRPPGDLETIQPRPPVQARTVEGMLAGLGVRTAEDLLSLVPTQPDVVDRDEAKRALGALAERLPKPERRK